MEIYNMYAVISCGKCTCDSHTYLSYLISAREKVLISEGIPRDPCLKTLKYRNSRFLSVRQIAKRCLIQSLWNIVACQPVIKHCSSVSSRTLQCGITAVDYAVCIVKNVSYSRFNTGTALATSLCPPDKVKFFLSDFGQIARSMCLDQSRAWRETRGIHHSSLPPIIITFYFNVEPDNNH